MNKREFKKILREKNSSAKRFTTCMTVLLVIFIIMILTIICLQCSKTIPLKTGVIIELLIILFIGIPAIIIYLKNDIEINNIYKNYKKEKDLSKYIDKTKVMKIVIIIEIVLLLVSGIYIADYIYDKDTNNEPEWVNLPSDISVETKYQDIGDFSIRIPKDFEIMSDEAKDIKYPLGNGPTLVYTNEDGSINVGFNLTNTSMKNSEVEEYTKLTEKIYKQTLERYDVDVEVSFIEKEGHKIGNLEFISPAIDTNIYSHIIIFSANNKLTIATFNCIEEELDDWKEVGDYIINSITFE